MKVIYTDEALENLDGILAYIAANYPTVLEGFQGRLRSVIARIAQWPDSAQEVAERPGVRVAPLIRYPYKVFTALAAMQSRYCTSTTQHATHSGNAATREQEGLANEARELTPRQSVFMADAMWVQILGTRFRSAFRYMPVRTPHTATARMQPALKFHLFSRACSDYFAPQAVP